MATLECQNKNFPWFLKGWCLTFRWAGKPTTFPVRLCAHTEATGQNIDLAASKRSSLSASWIFDRFKHHCVRSGSCLTNIVSGRHKWGRGGWRKLTFSDDFECQKCKFVEWAQAPFQNPLKTLVSMQLIAFQDRNCFEMLIFVGKKNNLNSHLKIVVGVLFIIIFMSLKAWMLHKFASDAVARNQDILWP